MAEPMTQSQYWEEDIAIKERWATALETGLILTERIANAVELIRLLTIQLEIDAKKQADAMDRMAERAQLGPV